MDVTKRDVVIIGGGFYGCFVAYQIASTFPDLSVTVLEKENALFLRGSSTNQGQLHKGYMYSIDPELAGECARNVALFEEKFRFAVDHDVTGYYAIHRNSEIGPDAFERFCASLGIPLRSVDWPARQHFDGKADAVYATTEKTFNNMRLQAILRHQLVVHRVEARLSHGVRRIEPQSDGLHRVVLDNGDLVLARSVYNTSFADINAVHQESGFDRVPIRCEVFLHFLVGLPPEFASAAVSVIRGPFASIMPSRFRGGHLVAAAGFRKLRASDGAPPSEYVDQGIVERTYAESVESCGAYLPVLRRASYLGHVVGTRAAFIEPRSGETTSRVTPLLDFSGIENYHVMLGGKVACLLEAREPALRGARAIHAARTAHVARTAQPAAVAGTEPSAPLGTP